MLLGYNNTKVIIDSLDIRLEVSIGKSRNFNTEPCKWLTEMCRELTGFV